MGRFGVIVLILLHGPSISKWGFFLGEITKTGIVGRTVARSIPLSSRSTAPYAPHFLGAAKRITPAQLDTILCAGLPDPGTEPYLYNIISEVMIHSHVGYMEIQMLLH